MVIVVSCPEKTCWTCKQLRQRGKARINRLTPASGCPRCSGIGRGDNFDSTSSRLRRSSKSRSQDVWNQDMAQDCGSCAEYHEWMIMHLPTNRRIHHTGRHRRLLGVGGRHLHSLQVRGRPCRGIAEAQIMSIRLEEKVYVLLAISIRAVYSTYDLDGMTWISISTIHSSEVRCSAGTLSNTWYIAFPCRSALCYSTLMSIIIHSHQRHHPNPDIGAVHRNLVCFLALESVAMAPAASVAPTASASKVFFHAASPHCSSCADLHKLAPQHQSCDCSTSKVLPNNVKLVHGFIRLMIDILRITAIGSHFFSYSSFLQSRRGLSREHADVEALRYASTIALDMLMQSSKGDATRADATSKLIGVLLDPSHIVLIIASRQVRCSAGTLSNTWYIAFPCRSALCYSTLMSIIIHSHQRHHPNPDIGAVHRNLVCFLALESVAMAPAASVAPTASASKVFFHAASPHCSSCADLHKLAPQHQSCDCSTSKVLPNNVKLVHGFIRLMIDILRITAIGSHFFSYSSFLQSRRGLSREHADVEALRYASTIALDMLMQSSKGDATRADATSKLIGVLLDPSHIVLIIASRRCCTTGSAAVIVSIIPRQRASSFGQKSEGTMAVAAAGSWKCSQECCARISMSKDAKPTALAYFRHGRWRVIVEVRQEQYHLRSPTMVHGLHREASGSFVENEQLAVAGLQGCKHTLCPAARRRGSAHDHCASSARRPVPKLSTLLSCATELGRTVECSSLGLYPRSAPSSSQSSFRLSTSTRTTAAFPERQ
nr:hypothetical protein CFP56_67067 [Quercus suber]